MKEAFKKALVEKTGKSEQEIVKLYNKAKDIVKKEYPDAREGTPEYYKIVVGVLKNMLKINEDFDLRLSEEDFIVESIYQED